MNATVTFGDVADAHPDLCRTISTFDLYETASVVGSLMLEPGLQSQAVRIEALLHLVVMVARGRRSPNAREVARWLGELGDGIVGELEDPPEDAFASRVLGKDADYLILNGIYEGSAYQLQRFLNILEMMPTEPQEFSDLRDQCTNLLRLSDHVARDCGIEPHWSGEQLISRASGELGSGNDYSANASVHFSPEVLNGLGVEPDAIGAWVFDLGQSEDLRGQWLGSSSLERMPLLARQDGIYLVYPPAVSVALRLGIAEFHEALGLIGTLSDAFALDSNQAICRTSPLGCGVPPSLPLKRDESGFGYTSLIREFDRGHFAHFLFVVDHFDGHQNGIDLDPEHGKQASKLAEREIASVYKQIREEHELRGGLSLLVSCQWGRGIAYELTGPTDPLWHLDVITAADLEVLSWEDDFGIAGFWRMKQAQRVIANSPVDLFYMNGPLNLYSWAKRSGGSLVPHESMHIDSLPIQSSLVVVDTNCLLKVRCDSARRWDVRRLEYKNGERILVRRLYAQSFFPEDWTTPTYGSIELAQERRLVLVHESACRPWWFEMHVSDQHAFPVLFNLWEAMGHWIERSAVVLEGSGIELPDGPIFIEMEIADTIPGDPSTPILPEAEAKQRVSVTTAQTTIRISVRAGFFSSFRTPDNVAERMLVEAMLEGVLSVPGATPDPDRVAELVAEVVPNQWARSVHTFVARQFNDFVSSHLPPVVRAGTFDHALLKLGWGFLPGKESGYSLDGAEDCCRYLNAVVENTWSHIRASLKQFNKQSLLARLVEIHEAATFESNRWLKTSRAVVSLRPDPDRAKSVAAAKIAELTAVLLECRILVEMAVCECPNTGGAVPADLDLRHLMAQVMHVPRLGGSSEAIRYGGQEATVRVSALGDVLMHADFEEQVVNPYGFALSRVRYGNSVETYKRNFREAELTGKVAEHFDAQFVSAWEAEFGFSIDDARMFADAVENHGIEQEAAYFLSSKDDLVRLSESEGIAPAAARNIVAHLSQVVRNGWDSTPPGFAGKDWQPWRFRRRLSLIVRPLLPMGSEEDSPIMVPAGIVRMAIIKLLDYCHGGGFDARAFPPGGMRSWIGAQENRRGHAFNRTVCDSLRALGWAVETDIKLTHILNKKLDRDYGDVDVLAWKDNRVLALECKDLELAMTMSDIARQLNEFRGVMRPNGKPDRLKKHLDRCEVLQSDMESLAKFTSLGPGFSLQGGLVFSSIVPMQYVQTAQDLGVQVLTSDDLDDL